MHLLRAEKLEKEADVFKWTEGGFYMAYCKKCGMKMVGSAKVCPACGSADGTVPERPAGGWRADHAEKLQGLFKTEDDTGQFDHTDIEENKTAAGLSYLGLLVLVPLYAAKGSAFARYHAGQGLVLFLASAAYSIASGFLSAVILTISWRLYFILRLVRIMGLVFPVLAVIGIINAVSGKAKELPVIGRIRILK